MSGKLKMAAAVSLALAAAAAVAPTALAAPLPSNCTSTSYRICMYYNGSGGGAYYRSGGESIPDFGSTLFPNNGSGGGTRVKNNSASAANPVNSPGYIFYNEHCSGPYDSVPGRSLVNLVNTWNENASYENAFLNDGTVGSC